MTCSTEGQAPGGLGGNVRVVAKHVRAQVDGGVGHQRADGAQADDAERLAEDLWPAKAFFLFSASLPMVGESACSAAPGGAGRDAAACQQHAAPERAPFGVRVGARVLNTTTPAGAACQTGYCSRPRAGAGDGQRAFGRSMSCMAALRTGTPGAMSSVS